MKNRGKMDIVISMLHCKKLLKCFWVEAIGCNFYTVNKCPVNSVCDKSPQEEWSGRKTSFIIVRMFGSISSSHVPSQLRKKIDDRAEKCIFISYSQETKGYILSNLNTKS